MFFFPINTDAPIYHWPWMTVVLISVNVLVFGGLFVTNGEVGEDLILHYGEGLNPLEWITSNFAHAGLMHLAGNMIFLWSFGLVVEGKIGWWKFAIVYLGLGAAQCAIEQSFAMLVGENEGGSLGASAVIYGLMAMSLVWAPKNDLTCVFMLFFGFRGGIHEIQISILNFAIVYILFNALMAWFSESVISSELLHLAGAMLGFILATAMLKLRQVDCEGWDLYAVIAGREGEDPDEVETDEEARERQADRLKSEILRVRGLSQAGQADAALAAYHTMRNRDQLPRADLYRLITTMHAKERWSDSVPVMVDYLRRFTEKAAEIRLSLAQILIGNEGRPRQGLRVLAKLPTGSLPPPLERARQKLVQQAEKLGEDGVMELETEEW